MAPSMHPRRRVPAKGNGTCLSLEGSMKTLNKSATFHSPTSRSSPTFPVVQQTASGSDVDFAPPRQLRRSQTNLDDVVDAHVRRTALFLDNVDKSLSNTDSLASRVDASPLRDHSLPIPESFVDSSNVEGSMHSTGSRERTLRSKSGRAASKHHHASDSGLGSSIASTRLERFAGGDKEARGGAGAMAITRSAASTAAENVPGLSTKAVSRIHEHILRPLRAKPSLQEFEPIVSDIPRRIRRKEIMCLRDLEKTLLFVAPKTKSSTKYLDFCLTSLRCLQVTVDFISERDQIRPNDRPYTNGYLMDLEQQILQYAMQLAEGKKATASDSKDGSDLDEADDIRLFGGIAKNGRPAELVRVKNDGRVISLATGEAVDLDGESMAPVSLKRSLSEQAEDEEEIQRSMARRKKNAPPEELAPKFCHVPSCGKSFKRACDLTKHEKTHKRPWKCPELSCKYHTLGWPTEKELERHRNDKHTENPHMYSCQFQPCAYKSKRESNCKQHMEKAHGWTYTRQKTNGKKGKDQSSPSAPMTLSPISTTDFGVPTPPEEPAHSYMPDLTLTHSFFNDDVRSLEFGISEAQYPSSLEFELDTLSGPDAMATFNHSLGSRYPTGDNFVVNDDDIYAAAHIPAQSAAAFLEKESHIPAPEYSMSMPAPMQMSPAHFSPGAASNTMLYTPTSLVDVDEGYEDACAGPVMTGDFQLFPSGSKGNDDDTMMGETPSSGILGFSQPHGQEMFPAMMEPASLDWGSFTDFSRQYRR